MLLENPDCIRSNQQQLILWNSDLEAPHEGQEFVNVKTISAEGCEFNSNCSSERSPCRTCLWMTPLWCAPVEQPKSVPAFVAAL